MDATEPAIVRENVAYTFSTLISYRTADGQLSSRVVPHCAGHEPVPADVDHLDMLIKQHKLFNEISASLAYFHPGEIVDQSENLRDTNAKLTSCDLVRAYCVILSNLLEIKTSISIDMISLSMLKIIK